MSRYDRRSSTRGVKAKVLIMCGGETEKKYFDQFKSKYKDELKSIKVESVIHKRDNPYAMVEAATKKEDYDEIWVVFDKDDFPDFDTGIRLAKKNNINCAFSNEAFEYWFLLHFENRTGSMSRSELKRSLTKSLGAEYEKADDSVISRILKEVEELEEAERRAKVGHEKHIKESGKSPSEWRSCTTVYQLTKKLRNWSVGG